MLKPKYSLLIALAWLGLITFLLCTPGSNFPKIGWQDKVYLDKWIHVFLFMVLGIAWCRVYFFKSQVNLKKTFIIITVLGILYGVGMELVQKYFIPFRSFDYGDIAADTIGTVAGYFISVRIYLKNKVRSKRI